MTIGEFLKNYREGVKDKNNGKPLSVAVLSKAIGIKQDSIRNWERGYIAKNQEDRNILFTVFDLENLVEIPNERLDTAINYFSIDYLSAKADNVKEKTKEKSHSQNNNNEEDPLNLPSTKYDQFMLEKILGIMADANANMRIIAESNRNLSKSVDRLTARAGDETPPPQPRGRTSRTRSKK